MRDEREDEKRRRVRDQLGKWDGIWGGIVVEEQLEQLAEVCKRHRVRRGEYKGVGLRVRGDEIYKWSSIGRGERQSEWDIKIGEAEKGKKRQRAIIVGGKEWGDRSREMKRI